MDANATTYIALTGKANHRSKLLPANLLPSAQTLNIART